jgi:hypothetical protein
VPVLHLTDVSVRALKGTNKHISYMDSVTRGFGIRVGKHGKTWIVVRGRQRERVSFGRYPDLPLTDARKEAKKLLSAEPQGTTKNVQFMDARAAFLEEHYRGKAERTKAEAKRLLEKHFRELTKMVLNEVDDTHVSRCLSKLSETPSEQLHAFRIARCFFRWCVRPPRRYIKHSPMEGYEPPGTDRKGTRILSDAELVAVWRAAVRPQDAIVRVMMLWGTRNGETAALEREWSVDGVCTIPGEHTKNGRDHSVPVCPLAEHILSTCKGTNVHYFRGREGNPLSARGLAKIFEQVREASGTAGWTLRDLRRTFRSNMARLRVPREVCEVLINHAPPVLDEIYDRYDRITEKREALAKLEQGLIWLLARV